MIRWFSSLKTALVLVVALCALAIWGSVQIQVAPGAYGAIEEGVLLEWLRSHGLARPGASWWILALVGATALLALNAAVCTLRRLLRHGRRRSLPLRSAAAHGAHLGFLLVLLAHLIGSAAGFRSDGHRAVSGGSFRVPPRPRWRFAVSDARVRYAPEGYPASLSARVRVLDGDRVIADSPVAINRPLIVDGVATYLKDVRTAVRGWRLRWPGQGEVLAEVGVPVATPWGRLTVLRWAPTRDRRAAAAELLWEPRGAPPRSGWVVPEPAAPLPHPGLAQVRWGEIAVDTLATFDVRYDPGAGLALVGSVLLSLSLIPLLGPGGERIAARTRPSSSVRKRRSNPSGTHGHHGHGNPAP
ncbi:MAG: hypothetical protein Kow0092_22740 [Deferrisomatales bacterium]